MMPNSVWMTNARKTSWISFSIWELSMDLIFWWKDLIDMATQSTSLKSVRLRSIRAEPPSCRLVILEIFSPEVLTWINKTAYYFFLSPPLFHAKEVTLHYDQCIRRSISEREYFFFIFEVTWLSFLCIDNYIMAYVEICVDLSEENILFIFN